ncbi:hypothetical protein H8E07_22935, partial [bacterium]|nr:hypothetical protein [bacterium]
VEDTFNVTVESIGDDPVVAAPIGDVTVDEDAGDTVLDMSEAFHDPDILYHDPNIVDDDDILTLSITGNTNGALVAAALDGNELTLSCIAEQNGTANITIRATDSDANWVEDTFLVTVDSVNDAPVASSPLADVVVDENAVDTVVNLAAVFADVDIATDGDSLTFSVTGNTNPVLVDTGVPGILSYAPGRYGTAEITVRATDLAGAWAEDTFTVGVGSDGPAAVDHVLVKSSSWDNSFLDYLDAEGLAHPALLRQGYRIGDGAGQLDTLPWNNLDTLTISFSKDVSVIESDMVLYDASASAYAIDSFTYNSSTFTATWALSAPIGPDRLSIDLSDSMHSGGVALDGEWADGSGAMPSGNGTPGGDFQFSFNVLPGDADRSGRANTSDGNGVRSRLFLHAGDAGAPGYSATHDLNGSGRVDFIDWLIVLVNMDTSLPPGAPAAAPAPAASSESLSVNAPAVPPVGDISSAAPSTQPTVTAPAPDAPVDLIQPASYAPVSEPVIVLSRAAYHLPSQVLRRAGLDEPGASASLEPDLDAGLVDVLAEAEFDVFNPEESAERS